MFLVVSISVMVINMALQFYLANKLPASESDLLFFSIGTAGAALSMSTAGLSSYLIAEFSKKDICLEKTFSSHLSFLKAIFVILSISVVALLAFLSKNYDSKFLILMFFYVFASGLTIIFQSYSYSIGKYIQFEAIMLFCLIVSLIPCLFDITIYSLPIIFLAKAIFGIIIFYSIYISDKRYLKFRPNEVKPIFNKMKFLIFGGSIYKSEPIWDRYFIINQTGATTAFHIIMQIYNAALGVIYKVHTSKVISRLSVMSVSDKVVLIYKHVCSVIVIGLIGFSIMWYSPIIDFFVKMPYFNFMDKYVDLIYILYFYFLVSVVGQYVSSLFYLCDDLKTPSKVSIITFVFFLPAKFYVAKMYGVSTLGIFIALYHLVNTVILIRISVKRFYNESLISN